MRMRAVRRAGVSSLALFASATLLATSPAYAEPGGADLELTTSATSVTAGDSVRELTTTVVNKGPADGSYWTLEYDLSGLDDSKVTVGASQQLGCERSGEKLLCREEPGLAVGNSFLQKTPFALTPVVGKTGAAGSFTVTAVSDSDPDQANNSATVTVDVPAKGVDLVAVAEDVYQVTDDGELTDKPVAPGGSSFVLGAVGNVGDTIAKGLKVSVALPEHVTFAEAEPGCTYGTGNRTVTCDYEDVTLVPIDQDSGKDDDILSVVGIVFPVTVAKDAPGPVVLKGGKLTGVALATQTEVSPASVARSTNGKLPKGLKAQSAINVRDANPADNTAEFRVHVGAAGGSGSDGDGSGGSGGGLPVTGVQAGLIGGIGAGVVALGAVLFLVTRRRRLVLTAPDDEVPNA
ncbi:hypothetical protein ABZ783_35065 [Micromonospora sp. NPDC047738]|uniref:hypothetical protein n=1 Tax=Micromonospora sp. NPDC047738 TaxID=3155741 RepID=UPI0033D9E9A6